ncbi:peptidase M50 [Paramagnetospirillum kuznetsovii]|uniref:Peptidase M50 n=1 Tax=Paramagnetospirillum kuznetsovii TaxID=2053833 RepID=A0A364NTR6_9PROT|nr:HlyD family efflux transporter periplasmic adaptor subunit [Paramagnetospirillum kuznetsovii]RAU20267.1 peptidase M50 [Paramagnetospirillum kuznetsovii]
MLPPLRDELHLHPGPVQGGAPSWTLQDPVRNRFFRIGWPIFEILARWHLGEPSVIAQAVSSETALDLVESDVMDVVGFLAGNELLKSVGPDGTARLHQKAVAGKQTWAQWLLHHYLFIRIPLVRPDRLLGLTLPAVRWAFSRGFLMATLGALVVGLFLIIRQWEVFGATLVDTISPSGLVMYGVTLAGVKLLHELGHGYAAKRLGCRVPTMGLALLVMWPVLYTDVNETWKLTRRRDRLSVAAAGVLVELAVAAWATLAWGFLPDGALRGAAFMLASTTWLSSLVLNLSPFMRFDGYFLLMDALDMPNLHQRAFAVARWWLREVLFKLGEPEPERFHPAQRQALVLFAFGVWIYRLVLFLGIAALVYHFFIKAVGILLFAVEIGWFVFMPFWGEFKQWWTRRATIMRSRRSLAPLGLLVVLALGAFIPWHGRISAPAMLKADLHFGLYPMTAGRLERVDLAFGRKVEAGAVLAVLTSPDLDHRLAQAARKIQVLEFELAFFAFENTFRERSQALRQELETAVAERVSMEREKERQILIAPFSGRIVDPIPDLQPGQWISPKERLAAIESDAPPVIDAYVAESDVTRLTLNGQGRFVADDLGRPDLPCRIVAIDRGSVRNLADPALATLAGGTVSVRVKDRALVPDQALYRVRCHAEGPAPTSQIRGVAILAGEAESLAGAALRSAIAVLMRESGM